VKHVVVGVCALLLGGWGLYVWFDTFGTVMRGLVPILLVVFGLVALLAGYKRVGARPARGESLRRRAEREILDDDDEDDDEDEDEERGEERRARRGTDEDEERGEERRARRSRDEEPEDDELDEEEEAEADDLDEEEPVREVRSAKR
jgi:hypothetical protein